MSKMKYEQINKFIRFSWFMLCQLNNWHWKLPLVFLLGLLELGILIILPLIGAGIIDSLSDGKTESFKSYLVLLAFLTLGQLIIGYTNRYLHLRINESVGKNLRQLIVGTILSKKLSFFEKYWVGDIVSRSINDTTAVKKFLIEILLQIIVDGVTLIFVIIILISMNPFLALLTIATAPTTLIYGRVVQPRLETMTLRIRENIAALTGHLQSWFSRAFSIKAFSLESQVSHRFTVKNDELMTNSVRFGTFAAAVGTVNATLLSIPSIIIFAYGGYLTLSSQLTVGRLFAFITFSTYFNAPIQRLIGIWIQRLPSFYSVNQRIQQILTSEDIDTLPKHCNIVHIRKLSVNNLRFGFEQNKAFELFVPLLTCRCGEIVGITGPNGSGKSSLARLLMGLYLPQKGEIFIEAKNGHKYSKVNLRKYFAFLPQKPDIFDGTLLENVTLFTAEPDFKRLNSITKELNLKNWIDSLSEGWYTKINAGLIEAFSGGQMQKIGLARVLYLDSPIFLLDEPENGIDKASRQEVFRILCRLKRNRIVVLITHDSETLKVCDRVYSLAQISDDLKVYNCIETLQYSIKEV